MQPKCPNTEISMKSTFELDSVRRHVRLYEEAVKETPSHPCPSCNTLVFQYQFKNIESASLESLGLQQMNSGTVDKVRVCVTCFSRLRLGKIPEGASLARQMKMCSLPLVEALNPYEVRLISIRIPFSQIRELTYEGQSL